MSKSAKKISQLISKLMQEERLTIDDLRRGMVVLDNLSHDYSWKNGIMHTVDKPEKVVKLKEKKPVVLEECVS